MTTLPFMSSGLTWPFAQPVTSIGGMGLPSRAACGARVLASLSQVQSSGNSPARTVKARAKENAAIQWRSLTIKVRSTRWAVSQFGGRPGEGSLLSDAIVPKLNHVHGFFCNHPKINQIWMLFGPPFSASAEKL